MTGGRFWHNKGPSVLALRNCQAGRGDNQQPCRAVTRQKLCTAGGLFMGGHTGAQGRLTERYFAASNETVEATIRRGAWTRPIPGGNPQRNIPQVSFQTTM